MSDKEDYFEKIFLDFLNLRKAGDYSISENSFKKKLKNKSNIYSLSLPFLKILNLFLRKNRYQNHEILIVGSKMLDVVKYLSENYKTGVLVRGFRSRKEMNLHKGDLIPVDKFVAKLYRSALEDLDKNSGRTDKVVEELSKYIRKINPSVVILNSNAGKFERSLVYACSKNNIPTVNLQHGFLHLNKYNMKITNISDYMWFWDDVFKKQTLEFLDIESSRLKVIGYPFKKVNDKLPNNLKSICFLGQRIDNGNHKYVTLKYDYLRLIKEKLEGANIDLIYRPHPAEWNFDKDIIKNINSLNIKVSKQGESLKEAFTKYDMFLSFFSTSLYDALQNRKYAFQIDLEDEFGFIDLEKQNLVPKLEIKDILNIELIKEKASSYDQSSYDFRDRLDEELKKLIN